MGCSCSRGTPGEMRGLRGVLQGASDGGSAAGPREALFLQENARWGVLVKAPHEENN